MILEGNERGYGVELARHLLNPRDNDHVTVHTIDGFMADDLFGAFAESEAISQATQCQKYLFSLSLNPPPDAVVPVDGFEATIADVERKLGLVGQPRAIVFHEKNGRRHAHCVWSRIDPSRMRAVNLSLYKRKLTELSREIYLTHDWRMPNGFKDAAKRDPLNHSRAEAGQARRSKRDAKAVKAMFRGCWEASDSRAGFEAALKDQGFVLARGNRRGFVAIDADGKVWSLSRWCGVKPREMRRRLGSEDDLPSLKEVQGLLKDLPSPSRSRTDPAFEARRIKLAAAQRRERAVLLERQQTRQLAELAARQKRLPKGLRAMLARATGQYQKIVAQFAAEAAQSKARDHAEQQVLIDAHLTARRTLAAQHRDAALSKSFAASAQRLELPADDSQISRAAMVRQPELILGVLSQTKASFTRADILRALAKRIDDPLALRSSADAVLKSPEIVRLASDGTPRFTTRDYQSAEQQLNANTSSLCASQGFTIRHDHITSAISQQNAKMRRAFGGHLSDEQRGALDHILGSNGLSCVVGLAGAGKSTMLATARDAWERQSITVHGAALAGKAADGLESASGIKSRTLASLEMSWENGHTPINAGDVLVIDEAGMIGTRQLGRITAKINEIGAKLVLVGDPDQLQPIEAGTPFRNVVAHHGAAKLTEIHRQTTDWQKVASRDLAEGRVAEAIEAYAQNGAVSRQLRHDDALAALVERYAMDAAANGTTTSRLAFAHRRKDVFALNQAIRDALRDSDNPEPETLLPTTTGPRAFAKGERIVFTKNDRNLGVRNGMLGTVQNVNDRKMTVLMDGDPALKVIFDPRRFQGFDHGYAVTIHKSQGATVDQAYVLASRSMDPHLAYVAMTRHRNDLQVFINAQDSPKWAKQPNRIQPHQTRNRSGPEQPHLSGPN